MPPDDSKATQPDAPLRYGTALSIGILTLGLLAGLQGCVANVASGTGPVDTGPPTTTPIKHVVIIMQENRTVDNLFYGFPGADTVQSGLDGTTVVPMMPVDLGSTMVPNNSHFSFWKEWDHGKMDGFAKTGTTPTTLPYAYVPPSQIQEYWTLASEYTLSDETFQSGTGPSFPAHQYMIAAQSGTADEDPVGNIWGCDATPSTTVALVGPNGTDLPGVFPCFDYQTVADLLDTAGISWRYYTPQATNVGGDSTAFEAIKHIFYGSDWTTKVIYPQTQILKDIPAGQLAAVTWVIPDFNHSDHAGTPGEGPSWVAQVVNAIGNSKFWSTTAILINWDDWGGWYDHVVPPVVDNSMGMGFRVPLIVVSPYAKHGYVSHVQYETASLVTYIEKNFGLPDLGQRDAVAGDLSDCFDFTQKPAKFNNIATRISVQQLLSEPYSGPPDTDDFPYTINKPVSASAP